MIGLLEMGTESQLLSVELANDLTRTHVGADHFVRDMVKDSVVDQVLVAVGVEVIGNHVEAFAGGSYCQRTAAAEYVGEVLALFHHFEQAISFLLQSRAPIDLLKIELKLRAYLFQFHKIILLTRHHLQRRGPIDIMQFLGLVDHTRDVETFQKSDFADNLVIRDLFWGEVIVRKMADSLETVGEGDLGVSEKVEELLG